MICSFASNNQNTHCILLVIDVMPGVLLLKCTMLTGQASTQKDITISHGYRPLKSCTFLGKDDGPFTIDI